MNWFSNYLVILLFEDVYHVIKEAVRGCPLIGHKSNYEGTVQLTCPKLNFGTIQLTCPKLNLVAHKTAYWLNIPQSISLIIKVSLTKTVLWTVGFFQWRSFPLQLGSIGSRDLEKSEWKLWALNNYLWWMHCRVDGIKESLANKCSWCLFLELCISVQMKPDESLYNGSPSYVL